MMLEINILFNLFVNDYMFITSTIENFEGCSTAKFDSILATSQAQILLKLARLKNQMIPPTNMLKGLNSKIDHNYKCLPLLKFEMCIEAHHLTFKYI
jgi:hypothetical protein